MAHSEREMASIEDKLATLYERRGQIVEAMRALGSDQEQHQMLQEREALTKRIRVCPRRLGYTSIDKSLYG